VAFRSLHRGPARPARPRPRRNDLAVLEAARDVFAAAGRGRRPDLRGGAPRRGRRGHPLPAATAARPERAAAAVRAGDGAGPGRGRGRARRAPTPGTGCAATSRPASSCAAAPSRAGRADRDHRRDAPGSGPAEHGPARRLVARAKAAGHLRGRRHRAGRQLADRAVQPPARPAGSRRPRSATCGPVWSPSRAGRAPGPPGRPGSWPSREPARAPAAP